MPNPAIMAGKAPSGWTSFTDDFSGTLDAWTILQGSPSTTGGVLNAPGGSDCVLAVPGECDSPDQYAEVTAQSIPSFGGTVILNLRTNAAYPPSVGYYFRFNHVGNVWEIGEWPAASLATFAATDPATPYRFRAEAIAEGAGVRLNLYEDVAGVPTLRVTHHDTTAPHLGRGTVQIRADHFASGNVTADNFEAGVL
jgi:hypothetical protein